jgi:undecaprenyl phosphate-alpha-L-ara4FN deformylase
MPIRLALKVDVDTDRGTREGVPNLVADLQEFRVPAVFLFSLGPDQTGRAITRIFRPGFLAKAGRTSVLKTYGWRTLLNGTLRPAPHIGRRNTSEMRAVRDAGFEVGIHCFSHYRWQDHLAKMAPSEVAAEFDAAADEFRRIFEVPPRAAGAAGWQSNALSRGTYERAGLLYASDSRGTHPYFPRIGGRVFQTLEIPTTLPTLDELMGRTEFPDNQLIGYYTSLLQPDRLNVFTLHAEIEGMSRRKFFRALLSAWTRAGVQLIRLDAYARTLLMDWAALPVRFATYRRSIRVNSHIASPIKSTLGNQSRISGRSSGRRSSHFTATVSR